MRNRCGATKRIYLANAALIGLTLLIAIYPPQPSEARDAILQGVAVGTAIPHQLDVPDQTNQVQSFVTLKKNRGLILIFSRSLSW